MPAKKAGILGGTFDPIHNGHTQMARYALEEFDLDEIWFMPSANPPHKMGSKVSSSDDRSKMCKLAIDRNDRFVFSDYELKRGGFSYTAETLELLKSDYPEYVFYFIMGGDSFLKIEKWYRPDKIMALSAIIAFYRSSVSYVTHNDMSRQKRLLEDKYNAKILLSEHSLPDVSSSMIRSYVNNGVDISKYVSKKVSEYIKTHELYQAYSAK